MAFPIRDATLDDLPAIVEIYNSTIASRMVTANTEPVSIESRVPWFHAHNPQTRPLWVVDKPSETQEPTNAPSASPTPAHLCGWLSFNSFLNGRPAYDGTAEISIYINEAHRRSGLGRYLLGEAIRRAPACAVNTLVGIIFAHNEPSLRLFDAFGFERWGFFPRVGVLDGIERDVVVVGRRIDK